ncbi:MAG: SPFH domain-containing protein [Candidatus Nanoarchaeia archaeon]|jgi:regulator of protease activity HflC (stomatin/prohibitin superfamily)
MIKESLLVAGIVGLIVLFITNFAFRVIIYIIFAFIGFWLFITFFVKRYDETERAIIFRLGKFNRIGGPGWSIVVPFFEKEFAKVDVRTKMMNVHIPVAFTKDDLRLELSGIFYYQINNPEKAILHVESYERGINNIIISETRNAIASLMMREVFAKMDKLNEVIMEVVRHATWKWGIDVNMVQVKGITPPIEIAKAMEQKEIAAQELQAKRFSAEARKVAIEAIGEAAKKLDDVSIMYLYIKALEEMSQGQATKMVFPMEFMNIMNSMKKDPGTALAGLNVTNMIGAMKDKIMESK